MELFVQINGKHWISWQTDRVPSTEHEGETTPEISLGSIKTTPSLTAEGTYPTGTLRISLADGDAQKAQLMLEGEAMRVDAAASERITKAIVENAAQLLLDITTDLRRQGLFLLPFRFYTMIEMPDGTLSYPSPQAVALPTDFPPHPEITAYQATTDTLTLAVRFPVCPHRLKISVPDDFPARHTLHTFVSYPLYIPDPKEMRGSIGSVRSVTGGNHTGIRFGFLSTSAIKSSVAAPEKYYRLSGNERTGYRPASKAATPPDYSVYARIHGILPDFQRESMLATGSGVGAGIDPMDWIADWEKYGEGYLPASLPYIFRSPADTGSDHTEFSFMSPPFRLKDDCGRLGNEIRTLRLHGLPNIRCRAILYGSRDRANWQPLRSFNPHRESMMMAPPRIWWRILIKTQ